MKIRQGFVSNSSSSSFIINKENLTPQQIKMIFNHIELDESQDTKCGCYDEGFANLNFPWIIEETELYIKGDVHMNNFNMGKFLKIIGVDPDNITWEYGG